MIAFCWASGQIEFGRRVPRGAIAVARGHGARLRKLMEVTARHAYDGKTLLVPGVPEAKGQDEAGDALMHFLDWLRECKEPGVEVGSMKPREDAS